MKIVGVRKDEKGVILVSGSSQNVIDMVCNNEAFNPYEFMLKAPEAKVLLIDKGHNIYDRRCPILEKKIKQCPKDIYGKTGCKPACSMTSGFGGCGAFSDGKFNITSDFGGWMGNYIDTDEVIDLIKYVDSIQLEYGAPQELTNPNTREVFEIEKKGIAVGLKLLRSEVRHLGTEINLAVLKNIYEAMKGHIDYKFKCEVKDIVVEDDAVKGVILKDGTVIESDYVILGVGRPGAQWLSSMMIKHGVEVFNNRVDIGVRVETNNIIMDDINKHLYEGKFIFNTSVGTQVRTFCSNPSGHVVIENHNGIMVCNGHSYHSIELGSNNTNFALLVSHEFSEPFKDPNEYAYEIFALLALHVACEDAGYLERAKKFCDKVIADFWDEKQGGFFLYGEENEQLILRPKETYDGAIFSGNSVMAYNLVQLYRVTGEERYFETLIRQLAFMSSEAGQYPAGYAMTLISLSDFCDLPEMVKVVCDGQCCRPVRSR